MGQVPTRGGEMRKVLGLVCAFLFVAGFAFAKDYATKGALEFGVSEQYGDVITNLTPEVHYFVADNISLGGRLSDYNYTRTQGERSTTEYLLNPRYVADSEGDIYPFGGLLIGISKDTDNGDETSGTEFGIEAGIKVKVTASGMLNIGLQYLTASGTEKEQGYPDADYNTSNVNIRVGFTLYR